MKLPKHNPSASKAEVKAARKELLDAPLTTDDGRVFDFDRDSRDLMEMAVVAMSLDMSKTAKWRLADNSVVELTFAQLRDYFEELKQKRALRSFEIDQRYLALKQNATAADLKAWRDHVRAPKAPRQEP